VALSVSEQLVHSTVRIEAISAAGDLATGTGFFFRLQETGDTHVPVIVTNRHVVSDAQRIRFHMTLADVQGEPRYGSHIPIEVTAAVMPRGRLWVGHPDPAIDLAMVFLAPVMRLADAQKIRLFYVTLDASLVPSDADLDALTAVEDILMIGYPNGIWDTTNNLPIVRKGVTATHPARSYCGRAEFMIDAACFPGSSGSPVFLFNAGTYYVKGRGSIIGARTKFLGVLYAGPQHTAQGEIRIVTVPTHNVPVAISAIPNHLGNVIRSGTILDFLGIVKGLKVPGGG
jgi:hypothetical protein